MLWFYRLMTSLLTPLAMRRWRRESALLPPQRQQERLGNIPAQSRPLLWVHAASVGEVKAVLPLLSQLLEAGQQLMVSTQTNTGMAYLESHLQHPALRTALAPLDQRASVNRWLDHVCPDLLLVVETELWPETLHQCHHRQIPVILINARISARAYQRYRWVRPLLRPVLGQIKLALTQSQTDSDRLIALGLPKQRQQVLGNLKFEANLSSDRSRSEWLGLCQAMAEGRPCWVAGSTRIGEDAAVLEAHQQVLNTHPDALLMLAPRHLNRVDAVLELAQARGLVCRTLTSAGSEHSQQRPTVLVIDQMGALPAAYAVATVCFVGGSLVPIGGHNLIEPAALGKAVVVGPHLSNQSEAYSCLRGYGALTLVFDAHSLASTVRALLSDPDQAKQQGEAALQAVTQHRGVLSSTLAALQPWLPQRSS